MKFNDNCLAGYRCPECGAKWQDLYKLTGLGNFPDRDFTKGDR